MAHDKDSFFKIYRSLIDSDLWLAEPFTKGQAWVDLIGRANFRDLKKLTGDEVMVFKRGQVVTSERTLATRWKWSREKVRNFLMALASDGMATTKKTTRGVVITIENYAFYQDVVRQKDHKTGQQPTTDRPLTDHKKTENKNDKNDKNVKEGREGELRSCGPNGRLALTAREESQFREEHPEDADRLMAELDEYKGATGKKYVNDYAALRRWAQNDKKYAKTQSSGGYKSGAEKVWEDIENGGAF